MHLHVLPLHPHQPKHHQKSFGAKFNIAKADYDWAPTFCAASSQLLPIIRTYAGYLNIYVRPMLALEATRPVSKFTCLSVAGPIMCLLGMHTLLP